MVHPNLISLFHDPKIASVIANVNNQTMTQVIYVRRLSFADFKHINHTCIIIYLMTTTIF